MSVIIAIFRWFAQRGKLEFQNYCFISHTRFCRNHTIVNLLGVVGSQ